MTWTEERVTELSRLWASGYSASAIGRMLGVTKNAVVGKAHRMRLEARPSPIRRDQRAPARRRVPMPTQLLQRKPMVAVAWMGAYEINDGADNDNRFVLQFAYGF